MILTSLNRVGIEPNAALQATLQTHGLPQLANGFADASPEAAMASSPVSLSALTGGVVGPAGNSSIAANGSGTEGNSGLGAGPSGGASAGGGGSSGPGGGAGGAG